MKKDSPKKKKSPSISIIDAGTIHIGQTFAEGTVEISGTVSGLIFADQIIIRSSGCCKGNMIASKINVQGKIEGSITCSSLVADADSVIIGDVRYENIIISSGSVIEGKLSHKKINEDELRALCEKVKKEKGISFPENDSKEKITARLLSGDSTSKAIFPPEGVSPKKIKEERR